MSNKCYTCRKQFKSQQAYDSHQRSHKSGSYTPQIRCCSILTKQEVAVSQLDRHDKAFRKNIIFQENIAEKSCPKCKKIFKPTINQRYISKFCSISCANSKTNSGRTKKVIYLSSKISFKKCARCSEIMVLSIKKPNRSTRQIYCEICISRHKKLYRAQCRFKLSPIKHRKLYDFNLIKKFGWYQPYSVKNPNPNGVTWDHLYRIQDGFRNNIPPEIISHPANAELVPFQVNQSRKTSSQITLNELYDRIEQFETKILQG